MELDTHYINGCNSGALNKQVDGNKGNAQKSAFGQDLGFNSTPVRKRRTAAGHKD